MGSQSEHISKITIPDGPCIELKPRTNSIRMGNRYINLQTVAAGIGCSEGYLSKVIRDPDRDVSMRMGRKLAEVLKITLDELDTIMSERKKFGNRPLSLS
jgi:hypothetical protein